jgi:hypothetical protein
MGAFLSGIGRLGSNEIFLPEVPEYIGILIPISEIVIP